MSRRRLVVLLLTPFFPGACGSGGGAPIADGALPVLDLGAKAGDLAQRDNEACEAELLEAWERDPPMTGLGAPAASASYQRVIGALMRDFDVPGGAVAVTRDGRLVLARAFGLSDVEQAQPAHPDQLFRIASLSKQITATAVMRLVAENKLRLDDAAFPLLPELAPLPGTSMHPDLARVTVRHLLNHTGGWHRDVEPIRDPMFASTTVAAALGVPGPATCADTIRYMLDKKPTYAAGTTYCYSNFGYCVLGRVIEHVTRKSFAAHVDTTLLAPTRATRIRLGRSLLADRADDEVRYYGHTGEGQGSSVFPLMPGLVPWEYGAFSMEALDAHGGYVASVVDLLRTQLAVDGLPRPPDLLDEAARALLYANPGVPSCTEGGGSAPADPGYWYGFGWSVNRFGNHWHTGSLPGTATEDVTAANGFSWAAFFNTRPADGAFFGRLDQDLWRALEGVSAWTGGDYFDQFNGTGLGSWRAETEFAGEQAMRRAAAQYPVRLEGRALDGRTEYRAEWAALNETTGPSRAESMVGADCLAYRTRDAELRALGYAPVSLQSHPGPTGRRFQASWVTYPIER